MFSPYSVSEYALIPHQEVSLSQFFGDAYSKGCAGSGNLGDSPYPVLCAEYLGYEESGVQEEAA